MKRYKALKRMSLRQNPDHDSPKHDLWHVWEAGTVFTPPAHLNIESALARGIMVEVKEGRGPAPVIKRGGKG